MPGFVATEGFPQKELVNRAATRWMVSTPEKVAEAIVDAGLRPQARALRAAWLCRLRGTARARARPRAPHDRRRGVFTPATKND